MRDLIDYVRVYGWIILVAAIAFGALGTILEKEMSQPSNQFVSDAESKAVNITGRDFCEYEATQSVGHKLTCYNNRTIGNTTVYTGPVSFQVVRENQGFILKVLR